MDTPPYAENRLSVVPVLEEYDSLPGEWLYFAGDEPEVSSWRALEAVLYASISPEDAGPRSGMDADFEETSVAAGKLHLTIGQRWLVGLFVSGEKRLAGGVGRSAARWSIKDHGLLAFYWALADIELVGVEQTKKYFRLWDNVMYVESNDPRSVLELRIVAPQGPDRAWASSRGFKGMTGATSSMMGLLDCLTEQVSRARGAQPRQREERDGPDVGTAVEFPRAVAPNVVDAPVAGWLVDPTGRHERRWWDGVRWTQFVWTNERGCHFDPDPPTPPPPDNRTFF